MSEDKSQASEITDPVKDAIEVRFHPLDRCLILDNMPEYWEEILQTRNWEALQKLFIGYCIITDQKIDTLNQFSWALLGSLSLYFNKLTFIGVQKLIVGTNYKNLKFLQLRNNKIGCKGVKALVKGDLQNLETLNVDRCSIGGQGIKNLTKGYWKKLKEIDLHNNMMSGGCIEDLQNVNWQNCSSIYIYDKFQDTIFNVVLITTLSSSLIITNKIKNHYLKQILSKITNLRK